MANDDYIRTRIGPDDKAAGEAVLAELGMTTSQALKLFWRQMILNKGLPFDVRLPNAETVAALNEDLTNAKRYKSARELRNDILSDAD